MAMTADINSTAHLLSSIISKFTLHFTCSIVLFTLLAGIGIRNV